jgi:hypothetical protein
VSRCVVPLVERMLLRKKILIYLDRFLMSELKAGKPLTREIAESAKQDW